MWLPCEPESCERWDSTIACKLHQIIKSFPNLLLSCFLFVINDYQCQQYHMHEYFASTFINIWHIRIIKFILLKSKNGLCTCLDPSSNRVSCRYYELYSVITWFYCWSISCWSHYFIVLFLYVCVVYRKLLWCPSKHYIHFSYFYCINFIAIYLIHYTHFNTIITCTWLLSILYLKLLITVRHHLTIFTFYLWMHLSYIQHLKFWWIRRTYHRMNTIIKKFI